MLGKSVTLTLVAIVLGAGCDSPPAPRRDAPPDRLVMIDRALEATPISEIRAAARFSPGASTSRFFQGKYGYNLGVGIGFAKPSSASRLAFHFDQTRQGALAQFRQLKGAARRTGKMASQDEERFCTRAARPKSIECAAVKDTFVVSARAQAPSKVVKRLLAVGVRYGTLLERAGGS